MATTAEAKLAHALLSYLSGQTFSPAMGVAWPNVDFSGDTNKHLRADIIPIQTYQVELGDSGPNRHEGILQVTVVWPEGDGEEAPREVAGQVISAFKRGTDISDEGLIIRIIRPPELAGMIQDKNNIRLPVSIRYLADIANP